MDRLTEREMEVLKLILLLRSNTEIAETLSISKHTVKVHLSSIFRKLGVSNRIDLAILADLVLGAEKRRPAETANAGFKTAPVRENSQAAVCVA
jgi:DNA-binding CsgD family transcriptional regulator